MKLIIQIPCLNEERTLPQALADLPTEIRGIDCIERVVIDDGSTDRTVEVARSHGVEHIVRHNYNKGLAAAFQTGLGACLELGADIIVNADGDNQYPGRYIAALVAPILAGNADIVIGDRQIERIRHFSWRKKLLQRVGSAAVRYVSGTRVPDAPSGFRAFSREAALRMNVVTGYTYTLDTIVQAGKKNLKIAYIPIETNPPSRESRLIRSTGGYVVRSATTILRLFALYEPFRTFAYVSLPFFVVGLGLCLRYLGLLVFTHPPRGAHIQSVVVGSVSLVIGFLIFLIGLLADIFSLNRHLQEETLYYLRREAFSRPGNRPDSR
ncbi:MAG: glycosyltransferase family 2 protein [Gemmatimonadetes bacterium]|nr:glycosyltransferase family 2 protein [Gemmatimonadota bacterium]